MGYIYGLRIWYLELYMYVKVANLPANAGVPGLIPGLGRSPGEGNDNVLQYSCLGNPVDSGAWWLAVHGVTKELDMT